MLWIAGVCIICLGVCLPLFMYYKKSLLLHLAVAFKMLGTLCAFLLALIAAIRLDPHCYICAGALLLYAVADLFIEYNLFTGMGFFLAGHICSIAFFLNLAPVSVFHLICLLLLAGSMAYIFYRWRKPIGRQMTVMAVYGASLILMADCAVSCFSLHTITGILIACGGALFCISDFMLLRRLLFPSGRMISWIIMVLYYTALLLFGTACLLL